MRALTGFIATCALAVASMTAGGCPAEKTEYDRVAEQLAQSKESIRKLKGRTKDLQAEVAAQRKQMNTLQGLGEKRLETLFHVLRIALGRYTGGVNLDDADGDDGIKVYLRMIDQDGSVIKAAGDVRIQLFDLEADPKENLIGQYEWKAEQLSKRWSGGFMTYHFSFECPWKAGRPKHDEITVRVEFTDYLTGKTFTAQKLCKVKLPAAETVKKEPGK